MPEPYIQYWPLGEMASVIAAERLDDGVVKPEDTSVRLALKQTAEAGGQITHERIPSRQTPGYLEAADRYEKDSEHRVWRLSLERSRGYVYPLLTGRLGAQQPVPSKNASSADEIRQVQDLLGRRKYTLSGGSGFQQGDALHFHRDGSPGEFSGTRIYVSSGPFAFSSLAKLLLSTEAAFYGGKTWLTGTRTDAPILYVNTHAQLESTLHGLYALKQQGELPLYPSPYALGRSVLGLPGVYVAQAPSGESFNGVMAKQLEPAFIEAMLKHNVKTGDRLPSGWYGTVAKTVADILRRDAHTYGMSSEHHAFVANEPVDEILSTIRQSEDEHTRASALS